jgi:hypothetical protein
MSSHITQIQLNEAYHLSQKGIRNKPFTARKISTKIVQLAIAGETIETWIDYGNSIKQELSRVVPKEGHYIIIMDDLKNSEIKKQKYFIPFNDFKKRYTMIDGTNINDSMVHTFETITMVQAKGIITGFKALKEDTMTGEYQKPYSWGEGVADGADQDGYWMASIEKPEEWYFMPKTHFNQDYIIIT